MRVPARAGFHASVLASLRQFADEAPSSHCYAAIFLMHDTEKVLAPTPALNAFGMEVDVRVGRHAGLGKPRLPRLRIPRRRKSSMSLVALILRNRHRAELVPAPSCPSRLARHRRPSGRRLLR